MTTIQIRAGNQSVIVNGEDLLLSMTGLFRVIADGDHLILEATDVAKDIDELATPENAEPAFDVDAYRHANEALQATVDELRSYTGAQAQTIKTYQEEVKALRKRIGDLERATDVGENFWNNWVQSENPKTPSVRYRVSLYRLSNGRVRGRCSCMDHHINGWPKNPDYYCKHIEGQIREANGVRPMVAI